MAYNNGYGAGSNPYAQQDNYSQPYGQQQYNRQPQQSYQPQGRQQQYAPPTQPYASDPYANIQSEQGRGRDEYGTGQNVEMAALDGQQQISRDPNAILNECRQVDQGISSIEENLAQLRMLQDRSLAETDSSANSMTTRKLDAMSSDTMTMYREFASRIKRLKQMPESGSPKNAPQLGKVDRRLKTAINQYQRLDAEFRKKLQDQMARQYRIVRPEATDAEVMEAVEDTSNRQVFSQALMQSDRRGQAQSALRAVESRHTAIQKIESQMIELAELFQDMDVLVVQQEAAVANIETKGEEVQENLSKGNEQIVTAITSARSRNRKKWWCLLIAVIIVVIIVVVAVVVTEINKSKTPTTPTKRALLESMLNRALTARTPETDRSLLQNAKRALTAVAWVG